MNKETSKPTPQAESNPRSDLKAAAVALSASAAEQAAARAVSAAAEADTASRAYKLLQADCKAGTAPKGWSHYIEQASQNQ